MLMRRTDKYFFLGIARFVGWNGMTSKRKSWEEKLVDKKGYPKVLRLEKRFPCYNAVHSMGISTVSLKEDITLVFSGSNIAHLPGHKRGHVFVRTC